MSRTVSILPALVAGLLAGVMLLGLPGQAVLFAAYGPIFIARQVESGATARNPVEATP